MLSPTPDLGNKWRFTELWVDSTAVPAYDLILSGDNEGNCCVYDAAEGYKIVFASSISEEAKLWLMEDEYERIEGQLRVEEVV